jgi:hypothetical protein
MWVPWTWPSRVTGRHLIESMNSRPRKVTRNPGLPCLLAPGSASKRCQRISSERLLRRGEQAVPGM